MLNILRKPLFWFSLIFLIWGANRMMSFDQPQPLSADGRGYYFYLPAILLQGDPSYDKTFEAESKYYDHSTQFHIFQDKEGNKYNKFFPGIAVLQVPFFGAACFASLVLGEEVNGFTPVFGNFFYLGYLVYTLLGIILFVKCVKIMYPNGRYYDVFAILVFLATPLIYYSFEIVLSHNITFFLFGLFTYLLLLLTQDFTLKKVFYIGLVLGLITIVRPTNALVILVVPFVLGSWGNTKQFFSNLFAERGKYLAVGLVGFLSMLMILFSIWKWQSGHWIYWPYTGEGFNWSSPKFLENLFSFRIGVFLHSPILILAFIALIISFKKQLFRNSFFVIYFLVITYVISSWWCWDYESTFGNRPFIEHFFFLLFPLVAWFTSRRKLLLSMMLLFAVLSIVRYGEYVSGFMVNQRFRADNYFQSMMFWEHKNKDRWTYNITCQPYGERILDTNIIDIPGITQFTQEQEFGLNAIRKFGSDSAHKRFYIRVNFERRSKEPLDEVFFVIDTKSDNPNERYYCAISVHDDLYAGIDEWDDVEISWSVPNNLGVYDEFLCYIWNKSKKEFDLRNYGVNYEVYEVKD